MRNVASLFRDYARLDLKRIGSGLNVREFERWSRLKGVLDHRLRVPPGAPGQEQRSSPRVPTRLRCSYGSCQELRAAGITNLATGGVFIQTTTPAEVGTRIDLRIRIEESGADLEVEAVVVSTDFSPAEPGKRGMGVRFTQLTADMIEELSQLYAREAEREARHLEGEASRQNDGEPASGDPASNARTAPVADM